MSRFSPQSLVLVVHEIYRSIQGESTFAGRPCVFVRLTACNLRCVWCDTPYAFAGGRKMSHSEIIEAVRREKCALVELTGGEPLLQAGATVLMAELVAEGFEVLLETGGHMPIDDVPDEVVTILDVKCPASGEADKMHWPNLDQLSTRDEVKFVISDRADFDYACAVVARHGLAARVGAVLFSPTFGLMAPEALSRWILEAEVPARLQLQMHRVHLGARREGCLVAGRAVVLLSGGLDSTTAAALASREGWALYGLTVRYGQVHHVELEAARRVASALGMVRHVELSVDLAAFGGSSLVGDGDIPKDGIAAVIPSTYVPARNTVLLSLALAWAEVLAAERIVIGVNALDYSGYPDCRPEFIAAFEYLATLATKAGVTGQPLQIWTPLQHLTKAGIIRLGMELGLDYGLTHSCYDPIAEGRPCGRCDSCLLRARGFAEAGVPDPLVC